MFKAKEGSIVILAITISLCNEMLPLKKQNFDRDKFGQN